MASSLADEVERVRGIVGRFFPIYDVRVRPEAIALYVRVDPHTLDDRFEELRNELKGSEYIPFLRYGGGEHILTIHRNPPRRFRGPLLNMVLLVATLATTVFAGMLLWQGYDGTEALFTLENLWKSALFFALPLMGILGVHEMGHYLYARKHQVAASLPFFIPAPFTIIGTFGALISMREPIPNKKALLDIGISGPLAGLAVAFPVTLLGLWMNALDPRFLGANVGGSWDVNHPLLYEALLFFIPVPDQALLHPTAFAGWVGLLVTALNLLPAGQLDGGHVARALLGERAHYLSYAAFVALMAIGILYFLSWIIIALFVLFIGLRHPPPLNDLTRLTPGRKTVGLVVLVILVLSFHPVPLEQIPVQADFAFRSFPDGSEPLEEANVTLEEGLGTYVFLINNTGNVRLNVTLELVLRNLPDWEVFFQALNTPQGARFSVLLDARESLVVHVLIQAPEAVPPDGVWTLDVVGTAAQPGGSAERTRTLALSVGS